MGQANDQRLSWLTDQLVDNGIIGLLFDGKFQHPLHQFVDDFTVLRVVGQVRQFVRVIPMWNNS